MININAGNIGLLIKHHLKTALDIILKTAFLIILEVTYISSRIYNRRKLHLS